MRIQIGFAAIFSIFVSCNAAVENDKINQGTIPIKGTWKLFTGTLIEKGDTVITDYTKEKEFIKIINDTHFSFLSHDLNKGKGVDASFSAGGGFYSLKDSMYSEHLQYCSAREWEDNIFHFTVSIKNDTLIQQGVERIDSLGVNRINIEKYIRMKD